MKKRVLNKQKLFIFISIIFISFCILFYGFRFIYYYRKFNKKADNGQVIQLLSTTVRSNNEPVTTGDGLYSVGSEFIFKGASVNNYVMYSGLLWRIVKINNDGSINLVTDKNMNEFMWGTTGANYNSSEVRKWLNENGDNTGIFYQNLYNPKTYLKTSMLCLDTVSNISNFKCDKTLTDDYVGLLSVIDYTSSIVDEQTYLNINDEYWLSTMVDSSNAWFVDSDKISKTKITDSYGIRPTITLNETVSYESGDGTINNPYKIGYNDGLVLGSHVKLGNDIWIVYEINNDNVRLALSGYVDRGNATYKFGSSNIYSPTTTGNLGYYLNNNLYENLPYKDLIINNDWYIGSYEDDFTNIYKDKVTAKIGLYNIADIKLNNETKNYYLLTGGTDSKVFAFDMSGYLFESGSTQNRLIKPAITIRKSKVVSGTGTLNDPYILEG
ncbi:MAG: hypothetical protein HFI86_06315 [Bacilli bacterium]|nr:hypothetical protein [Bacilli bacterium]MCI9434864.1 hypothetical protein [Bacilli bacterium]